MIAYLKGLITEINETSIDIECHGVGYEVYIPQTLLTSGLTIGKEHKLYIHEHIKEDAHDLYGFLSKHEKLIFRKLIGVSGIGPKGAINVFNLYTADEIIEIIAMQNTKALSKVNGIGPKTAQRILLELKDSISKLPLSMEHLPLIAEPKQTLKQDTVEALVALGYSESDALQAVSAIYVPNDTVENMIKKALSILMT